MMKQIDKKYFLLALFIISAVTIILMPFIGMKTISVKDIFIPQNRDSYLFWNLRLTRVAVSFIAGSALAVSGMVFQTLFRNALATPFTLGVASGAAFGASLYIRLGFGFSLLGFSGESLFAFMGAGLAILIVYGFAKIKQGMSVNIMLLSGVAMSFFFSSIILFMQYMSDFTQSFKIARWLMGGIDTVNYGPVFDMLPFVLCGSITIFYLANELNLMVSGEEIAVSRGVDVDKIKTILFLVTSLMIGAVVSICGPIGFVGMMAPHICRLIIGNDHKYLTPASILFGGIFLTMCDALSRTLIAPAEIPLGIITALLGGPFFIWLLLSKNVWSDGQKNS